MLQRHTDTSLSEASTVECAHETNDNIKLQTDRDGQMDRQRRTSHGNLHDTLSFQWLLLLLLLPGLGEAATANPRLSASCTYILSPRCQLAVAQCPLSFSLSLCLSFSWLLAMRDSVSTIYCSFHCQFRKPHSERRRLKMKVICNSHAAASSSPARSEIVRP